MIRILSGDIHSILREKNSLVADFLQQNDTLSLENIDVEASEITLADLLTTLQSLPMFSTRKMVVIYHLSSQPDLTNEIEIICQAVHPSVDLIIVEPKLDNKTTFGKFLKQQQGYSEYRTLKGVDLQKWLVKRAQALETKLDPMVARYLIERVGEDNLMLEHELQKMKVYPTITKELINELAIINPNSQVFDLLDAIFQGKLSKALDLYQEQRQQKNEPLSILGVIIWQLQILLIAKVSKQSIEVMAKEFRIHAFPLRKAKNIISSVDINYLNNFMELCRQTIHNIRTRFINQDEALLYLISRGTSYKR